jgi:hypothetical protein
MKLYHNVYGNKISFEFGYGHYLTSMSWVICPWISKNAINHFVYTLARSFFHQFWLYLYRMFITIRSWMSSILKEFWIKETELLALDFMKIALFCLVYTLASVNLKQPLWNIVTMYVAIRSRISLIIDLIDKYH